MASFSSLLDTVLSQRVKLPKFSTQIVSTVTLALLAGCGAPSPASYGSNWQPVHAYTPQVQKSPLVVPHVYRAHPSDASLRGLLARWSQEAGASLEYASGYEFSLVVDVNAIQNKSLEEALKELQAIYQPHGVEIVWRHNISTITVRDSFSDEGKPGARSASVKKSR